MCAHGVCNDEYYRMTIGTEGSELLVVVSVVFALCMFDKVVAIWCGVLTVYALMWGGEC